MKKHIDERKDMKRWFISPRTKCQEYLETDLFEVERSSLFSKLPFKVEIVARGWSSRGISSYISIQHVQTCASFIHCTKHRPHCKKQLFVSICIHGKLGLFSGFVKKKKKHKFVLIKHQQLPPRGTRELSEVQSRNSTRRCPWRHVSWRFTQRSVGFGVDDDLTER